VKSENWLYLFVSTHFLIVQAIPPEREKLTAETRRRVRLRPAANIVELGPRQTGDRGPAALRGNLEAYLQRIMRIDRCHLENSSKSS
ncbi:MAG: hypothetical protein KDG54_08390, partial [Geminicoccaceae bacterium]|nr:hypothetical protein [Geminicoccaceae bacterium]